MRRGSSVIPSWYVSRPRRRDHTTTLPKYIRGHGLAGSLHRSPISQLNLGGLLLSERRSRRGGNRRGGEGSKGVHGNWNSHFHGIPMGMGVVFWLLIGMGMGMGIVLMEIGIAYSIGEK